ncbi:MAG: hypothetical protein B5M54_11180 [Candidatus Aminicenantes bacterium 4484_214]|nr:MAG: hypothetical protein B5M54_11180 [Candidatus Aminicenantes bacterium 4484_214]
MKLSRGWLKNISQKGSSSEILFVLLLAFFLTMLLASCQSSSENFGHHFQLPPLPQDKPLRIVAFGDSTTARRPGVKKGYLERLQEKLSSFGLTIETYNAGVPGETTEDARPRLENDVLAHHPHLVIIQFGLNDAAIDFKRGRTTPWVSLDRYQSNLRYFIETLLQKKIYVLLMTPNPMRWTPHLKRVFNQPHYNHRFPRGINVLLRNYAWIVRNLSRLFSLPLIDVFRLWETREVKGEGQVQKLLSDGLHPNDQGHELIATWLADKIKELIFSPPGQSQPSLPPSSQPPSFQLPIIDLASRQKIQIVIDKDPEHYLGHPTTVLLEDGRTIIVVYPQGHGRGAIIMKKSLDGGRTWSERLSVPASWATSQEVPTIFRTIDAQGKRRLLLFSGLFPIRLAISEDNGLTWSELTPIGQFGGIVAMSSCLPLRSGPGHYLAIYSLSMFL